MINKKYYHPEIKWYTRLLPWFWIDNIDDPVPPSHFEGHYREYWAYRFFRSFLSFKVARWIWWRIRNPFHNFVYYTIGLSGRDISVRSKYPGALFAPKGFNWFIIQYKWLRLPGISYQGKIIRWYIGWLDDGKFGAEVKHMNIWWWIIIGCCLYAIIGFLLYEYFGWVTNGTSWKMFLLWPLYFRLWF